MEACCPLCKVTYYVTWELGDGVREQPVCPVDGVPLIAVAISFGGGVA